ncbi:MAG: terminase family protein [Pseudomonadales bacterium]
MADLNLQLLPWQQEVMEDDSRFKIVAAGRRTGKSHLAAISLILSALDGRDGKVFYVAPTQGQARDVIWHTIFDIANDIIERSHINNLEITLSGGNTIYLKGADRPDSLRGVSLKHLVLDEYAFMKPDVFESILRPALADRKGSLIAIGTPEGRNHFYDMFQGASAWDDWSQFHFTSFDNPLVDKSEIEHARSTLPAWAFQQEFMASFDARAGGIFDTDNFLFHDEPAREGDYYISIDLAGFKHQGQRKAKKRDNSAIAVTRVAPSGKWWVEDIIYGQWSLDETCQKIFDAVEKYRPMKIGMERGIAQQAVMSPLGDLMRRRGRVFHIELLTHGNQKKEDRIAWALEGRFANGMISLRKGAWNDTFIDEAANFPSALVHDDLIDALSYCDQIAQIAYLDGIELDDEWEPLDAVAAF